MENTQLFLLHFSGQIIGQIQSELKEFLLFPFSLLSQEDVLVINLSCENAFVLDSIIKKMESVDGVNRVDYFMPARTLVNEDWMREEIVKRLGSENLS